MNDSINSRNMTIGIALAAMLGGFAALLLSLVWSAAWAGLAISVLWGWFVVPLFSAPALTVAHAYGILLVVRALQGWPDTSKQPKQSLAAVLGKSALKAPLYAGLLILVGWIAKAWL